MRRIGDLIPSPHPGWQWHWSSHMTAEPGVSRLPASGLKRPSLTSASPQQQKDQTKLGDFPPWTLPTISAQAKDPGIPVMMLIKKILQRIWKLNWNHRPQIKSKHTHKPKRSMAKIVDLNRIESPHILTRIKYLGSNPKSLVIPRLKTFTIWWEKTTD